MRLGKLLKSVSKNYQRTTVEGICFDSRKVKKRIFFLQLKEHKYQERDLLLKQYQEGHQQS